MENSLQSIIENAKRDVRDLKTGHDIKSSARFYISDPVQFTNPQIGIKFKVKYKNPGGNIITTITSMDEYGASTSDVIPCTPSGDEQIFILCNSYAGLRTFQFMSNQPIESVTVVQPLGA